MLKGRCVALELEGKKGKRLIETIIKYTENKLPLADVVELASLLESDIGILSYLQEGLTLMNTK